MDFNRSIITTEDFNEICRLCLRRENLGPIFKMETIKVEIETDRTSSTTVLSEMINNCLGLEVILSYNSKKEI